MNESEFKLSERFSRKISPRLQAFGAVILQKKKKRSANPAKNPVRRQVESALPRFLQVSSNSNSAHSKNQKNLLSNRSIDAVQACVQPQADVTCLFNEAALNAIEESMREIAGGWRAAQLTAAYESAEACESHSSACQAFAKKGHGVRIWSFDCEENTQRSRRAKSGLKSKSASSEKVECLTPAAASLDGYRLWVCLNAASAALLVARWVGQIKNEQGQSQNWYVGFYSFSPFLAHELQQQYTLAATGIRSAVSQWEKNFSLPSVSKKKLKTLVSSSDCAKPPSARKAQKKKQPFSDQPLNQPLITLHDPAAPHLPLPRRGLASKPLVTHLKSQRPRIIRISRRASGKPNAADNIDFMI